MGIQAFNINDFTDDFHKSDHVRYVWGAKPDLTKPWSNVKSADCSGWLSKMLIMQKYPINLPRSSVEMRDWFLERASPEPLDDETRNDDRPFYRPASLRNVCKYARHDGGRLFIAGFDLGGTHRHIFSVCAGETMECSSGLHGVGTRSATLFIDEVDGGNGWIVEIGVSTE